MQRVSPLLARAGALAGILSLVLLSSASAESTTPNLLLQGAVSSGAIVAVPTNCGEGTAYRPAAGTAMTPADFEALGEPEAAPNSPQAQANTTWVTPTCSTIPSGEQPGGPASTAGPQPTTDNAAVTPTTPGAITPLNAGTPTMVPSGNWAGFQSATGDEYDNVQGSWTIPSSLPATPGGQGYESSWVGMGSGADTGHLLFQAGTEVDVSTSDAVTGYWWWQVSPENNQQSIDFTVNTGTTDYADVAHTGSDQGLVSICEEPTSGGTQVCEDDIPVSWSDTVGDHQYECIAERTEINKVYPRLDPAAQTNFSGCSADDTTAGGWEDMGDANRDYYYASRNQTPQLCQQSPWSARTGDITDGNFTVNWNDYGFPLAANMCDG